MTNRLPGSFLEYRTPSSARSDSSDSSRGSSSCRLPVASSSDDEPLNDLLSAADLPDSPESFPEFDIRTRLYNMHLNGAVKRKRRSSTSNGDIENSPVPDLKRLREENLPGTSRSQEECESSAVEQRLPLSELPVVQVFDSDEEDTLVSDDQRMAGLRSNLERPSSTSLEFGECSSREERTLSSDSLKGDSSENDTSTEALNPSTLDELSDQFETDSCSLTRVSSNCVSMKSVYRDELPSRRSSYMSISEAESVLSLSSRLYEPAQTRAASPQSDANDLATDEQLSLGELSCSQNEEGYFNDWPTLEHITEETSANKEEESSDRNVEMKEEPKRQIKRKWAPSVPENNGQLTLTEANLFGSFFKKSGNATTRTDLENFFKRNFKSGSHDRANKLFQGNPGLQPKMRSVLLEWIVEVCDVYRLHRETYHLTVDYLDRYLCLSENISKGQLQLIGVTALLIAAKYEEIYPPRISDFAYITDGACSDQDIIKMESLMVQVLGWRCTVRTSNSWVLGLLQLVCLIEKTELGDQDSIIPQYKASVYETIMHLLDLCTLDSGFVKFQYKELAVSSIYVVIPYVNSVVLKASGYQIQDLMSCIEWLKPFWDVLCEKFKYSAFVDDITIDNKSRSTSDFGHLRFKHNIDVKLWESVQRVVEVNEKNEVMTELLLTPPCSSEKRRGSQNKPTPSTSKFTSQ